MPPLFPFPFPFPFSQAHGHVIVRDLMKTNLPWIDLPWIGGAFTPPEIRSPEMQQAIRISDDLTAELKAADDIVIGTPMYNLSILANIAAARARHESEPCADISALETLLCVGA